MERKEKGGSSSDESGPSQSDGKRLDGTAAFSSPLKRSVPFLNLNSLTQSPKRVREVQTVAIPLCPLCPFSDVDPVVVEKHVNNYHFDSPEEIVTLDESDFPVICHICETPFESHELIQLHIQSDHSDLFTPSGTPVDACPVCQQSGFCKTDDLAAHIEKHFSKLSPGTPVTPGNVDMLLAKEFQKYEVEIRQEREKQEFSVLQNQYGMDSKGNYHLQSESNMSKAVELGKMSVSEYQERKIAIKVAERAGVDDGYSCTKGVITKITRLCEKEKSGHLWKVCFASEASHFATTYGDSGWGCGYRNIQMLLVSLLSFQEYRKNLEGICPKTRTDNLQNLFGSSSHSGFDIPSISRIQSSIETAWKAGFDVAGQEQLGGALSNTRKWIGATEVAALLSFYRLKYKLVDFHRPSGNGKTHPALFEWVYNYFAKNSPVKPCLYLQHQGHSRTIIGAERNTKTDCIRLLLLDPAHSKEKMQKIVLQGPEGLKLVRRNLSSLQSDQYQIVAVDGLIESEEEYQCIKVLKSTRIP